VLAHPPPGASGIAREARAISEDVVEVLGSRGRSGGRSALLASVSYGVVHHSRRPVLIVPPPS
jgi:nucleotide-binding universal stress UspA family protein